MEIEVPDQVRYVDMYILIRESLPADIRPISVHMMNLILGEDLVPFTCETAVIDEDSVYVLLLDAEGYNVFIHIYHDRLTVNTIDADGDGYVPICLKVGLDDDSCNYFVEEFHLYQIDGSLYIDLDNVEKQWREDNVDYVFRVFEPLPTTRRSKDEMTAFFITQIQKKIELSLAAIRHLSEKMKKEFSGIEDWEWHDRE